MMMTVMMSSDGGWGLVTMVTMVRMPSERVSHGDGDGEGTFRLRLPRGGRRKIKKRRILPWGVHLEKEGQPFLSLLSVI